MYELFVQYVAMVWLLSFGLYNVSVILRSMIHDRGYTVSVTDFITGGSATVLLVMGLPQLGILS